MKLNKWPGKPYITIVDKMEPTIFKLIDKVTSYKIKGFEFIDNQIYKCPKCGFWILKQNATSDYCKRCKTLMDSALWDGYIRLLSCTKSGQYYFPAGLLDTIENILSQVGIKTELSGWPERPARETSCLDLTWHGPDLRNHQIEAVTKAHTLLDRGRGAILEMPTGSGKTMTAMKLMVELNTTTLILVHKKNLMEQWQNVIKKNLNWEPELYGDKTKDIGPIVIGMVQSIAKSTHFTMHLFDFVIQDECHHAPAEQTYKILMKSNAYYKLGLSATPKREDGNEMKMFAAIGPLVKVTDVNELIKKGILAKPKIEYINAPTARQGNTYAESYKNQITMNDARNRLIAQKAYEMANKGLSVLITVNQIRHGKTLKAMIKGSEFVHGKTKTEERRQILTEFEQKQRMIIISTLLNEGSDIPTLDVLISAGGGKSEAAQIQKIGRALRTTDDKKNATIIDVLDGGKWMRDHAQGRVKLYEEMFK